MKFEVPEELESKVRNTADQWVEALHPGARIQGAAWYPLRVDYVPTALVRDSATGLWSSTVQTRLGQENGMEVMYAKPFTGWQRNQHHCSMVIKVATRQEQEKYLAREGPEITFHGHTLTVQGYQEARRPLVCYRCHAFGHTAVKCQGQETCKNCASGAHKTDECTSITLKCGNCQEGHKVTDPRCPAYIKEKTKYKNLSTHV